LFMNTACRYLFQVENQNQYLNKPITEFICPEYHEKVNLQFEMARTQPDEQTVSDEIECSLADGNRLNLEIMSKAIVYNQQDAILTIFRDITNRKKMERLKQDAEMIMQHDLKTPLNVMTGYSELFMKKKLPEDFQKYVFSIYESSNYMMNMLENSLDMIKIEDGTHKLKPEKFDLLFLINELRDEYGPIMAKKNVTLSFQKDGSDARWNDICYLTGEKIYIKRMLGNLIKNAIEASDHGNTVTVSIWNREDYHTIEIHNYGVIPESIRSKFFQKYMTEGKKGGVGLGTYSALLIARMHGGSIDFSSSKEEGTYIKVTIPKK